MEKREFHIKLFYWYHLNRRDLPWRKTQNAYYIWISEVILQQTRIAQGINYYRQFIRKFPTVTSLARAEPEEVMKIWEGLGYYTRALNLHKAAQQILERYGGNVPVRYDDLITLKGIGPYTAAAVASIAGDEPVPLVDGNVYRVFSRFFGISDPKTSTKGTRKVNEKARIYLNREHPGTHNQALMELGALICTPRKPDCISCPVQAGCHAFNTGVPERFPLKIKKDKVPSHNYHYFVIYGNGEILIRKRTEPGIWHMLYDFPLAEPVNNQPENSVPESFLQNEFPDSTFQYLGSSGRITHRLTHLEIRAHFHHYMLPAKSFTPKKPYGMVRISALEKYSFPALIRKYLNRVTEKNHIHLPS